MGWRSEIDMGWDVGQSWLNSIRASYMGSNWGSDVEATSGNLVK